MTFKSASEIPKVGEGEVRKWPLSKHGSLEQALSMPASAMPAAPERALTWWVSTGKGKAMLSLGVSRRTEQHKRYCSGWTVQPALCATLASHVDGEMTVMCEYLNIHSGCGVTAVGGAAQRLGVLQEARLMHLQSLLTWACQLAATAVSNCAQVHPPHTSPSTQIHSQCLNIIAISHNRTDWRHAVEIPGWALRPCATQNAHATCTCASQLPQQKALVLSMASAHVTRMRSTHMCELSSAVSSCTAVPLAKHLLLLVQA